MSQTSPPTNNVQLATIAAGILSAFAYSYLAANSQHYGDATLEQLLSVSLVCAAISFCVWGYSHYSKIELSTGLVIGFAVLFRLIGVSAFPILEDDMYRYLWDAHMTFEYGSPYSISPSQFFDADLDQRFESILSLINYPDIATVYGPVSQWAFALAYLISPGEIWPLQLLFALADIALIFVLLKLAKPSFVLLYAWSPLIVKEFAFTAHPDVLGALFLVLAFLHYQHQRFILVGFWLALATGVKVFAIIILPFLLAWHWRGWLIFWVTLILVSLPLSTASISIIDIWLPTGLRAMGSDWLFNAPLYALLSPLIAIPLIKLGLLISLAVACGLYFLHSLRNWPSASLRIDLIMAGLLICLPALNAWYLVWFLPFAVIRPSMWAWISSVALLLSYASGINLDSGSELGSYQIPNWVLAIEFGVIVAAVVIGQRPRQYPWPGGPLK